MSAPVSFGHSSPFPVAYSRLTTFWSMVWLLLFPTDSATQRGATGSLGGHPIVADQRSIGRGQGWQNANPFTPRKHGMQRECGEGTITATWCPLGSRPCVLQFACVCCVVLLSDACRYVYECVLHNFWSTVSPSRIPFVRWIIAVVLVLPDEK